MRRMTRRGVLAGSIAGPSALDLWYDRAGVWAALRAVVRDGSLITYVRA